MHRAKDKALIVLVSLLCMMLISGCFWRREVKSNQMGVWMSDGVSITKVVGAGRYSDNGMYAEMSVIDTSVKTLEWEDPDLWSKDKQPLSFKVSVTYARTQDPDKLRSMYIAYFNEAINDDFLARQVLNRIPRVAKDITTRYTLDEMIGTTVAGGGGRDVIQNELFELLQVELDEFGVELKDVGINNIGVAETYMKQLEEKAAAKIAVEVAQERTKQLEQQVLQERAQTEVAMEIARRNNEVAAEEAKVYQENPYALELKRLEMLARVIGDNDKMFFIPDGSNITMILAQEGKIVPVGQ